MLNKPVMKYVPLQQKSMQSCKLSNIASILYRYADEVWSKLLDFFVASVYPSMPSSSAFAILIMSSILRIVMAASVANCSTRQRALKRCFIKTTTKCLHLSSQHGASNSFF
jgi:hypothetical protein